MAYDFLKLPGEQMVPRAASTASATAPGQGKVSWLVVALIVAGLAVGYYLFNRSKAQASTEKAFAQGEAPWQAASL